MSGNPPPNPYSLFLLRPTALTLSTTTDGTHPLYYDLRHSPSLIYDAIAVGPYHFACGANNQAYFYDTDTGGMSVPVSKDFPR